MKDSLILIPGVGSDHRLWEHQVCHLEDLVETRMSVLAHSPQRAKTVECVLNEAPERKRNGDILLVWIGRAHGEVE
jgi:hypothetical protein